MRLPKTIILMMTLSATPAFMAGAAERITVELPEVAAALSRANAGDEICVADGCWNDVELKWQAPGRAVTVRALNPGGVRIGGKSSLRIGGDSLTVAGFDFCHAVPAKGAVVEFRNGKSVARACRLTDCAIDSCNPARRDISYSYIVMHGRHNRVDHCSLTGKLNLGVTLLVNLNDARSLDNCHRIDHNYFGPRPIYGSNGAETMRIGTSQQAYESSRTVVEDNYFDRCNGEVEIISVKSSDNIVRGNVFDRCEGVVALRHGKRNTVSGNIFAGHNQRNTGGVRVVDQGHTVADNDFAGLAGGRFFSALALMNSVPNSLPNRYVRVSDTDVCGNRFIDCASIEFGTGRDMERTEAPTGCRFRDNEIVTASATPWRAIDPAADVACTNNKIRKNDKMSARREARMAGLRSSCGAARAKAETVAAEPDTLRLEPGVVMRDRAIVVSRPTVILGADGTERTVLRWTGNTGGNFITIADGGSLEVCDVDFDFALQQGHATVRNAIATAADMIEPYNLTVKKCRFVNSPESGCCAVRGTKGTFAERVTVSECEFADLSGNGISLADETDDRGRYSADDITIERCLFSHMLGIPVNIYRGGSDESTAGPYVSVSDCSFTDCCNRERGSVLRLIGPQKLMVSGCVFDGSGRGGASIRLDETTWEDVRVVGCTFNDSGRVISNRNIVE